MENLELKGLHVDELQKLRVMDSELATQVAIRIRPKFQPSMNPFLSQTTSLKNECGGFVGQIADFQKMTDGFITLSDEVRGQLQVVQKGRERNRHGWHVLSL